MRIIFWWPYSTDKLRGFWTGGQKGVPSGPSKRGFCSGGDVALVQETAEKFVATQLRQDTLTGTTEPGVITTKKVEQEIASRIEDDIAAIDHYGNVTGSNALGKVNLGAVLVVGTSAMQWSKSPRYHPRLRSRIPPSQYYRAGRVTTLHG